MIFLVKSLWKNKLWNLLPWEIYKGDEYLQQFQEGNWTMKDTQFNYVSEPMPPGCGPQKVPPSTESATEQEFKYFFTGLFLHGEINL